MTWMCVMASLSFFFLLSFTTGCHPFVSLGESWWRLTRPMTDAGWRLKATCVCAKIQLKGLPDTKIKGKPVMPMNYWRQPLTTPLPLCGCVRWGLHTRDVTPNNYSITHTQRRILKILVYIKTKWQLAPTIPLGYGNFVYKQIGVSNAAFE